MHSWMTKFGLFGLFGSEHSERSICVRFVRCMFNTPDKPDMTQSELK